MVSVNINIILYSIHQKELLMESLNNLRLESISSRINDSTTYKKLQAATIE